MYEFAYGFTRLRVHSHVFMIWLAVLFAFFLAMLISRKTHTFATGVLIVSLGFIITLDLLNPDVFIVRQNVARYHRGEELDVRYLGGLSEDAVPHLIPFLSSPDAAVRGVAAWAAGLLRAAEARRDLENLTQDKGELVFMLDRRLARFRVGDLAKEAIARLPL